MTILSQMGGMGRLVMMIGAKQFACDEKSVKFRFAARSVDGSNGVKVTLDPSDTYTVEFFSARGTSYKVKKELSGVYADDLVRIFEGQTKLYLSFGRVA